MVTLQTDDIELPYPFNECDSFSIVDGKLKTLKNFPKNTMHNTILDIYFVECHMLEFKDSRYTLPKSDMNFFNMDKIHINDLFDFSLFLVAAQTSYLNALKDLFPLQLLHQ